MFLFLSKLLPLFVYPLGLCCILLTIALFLSYKRSRWAFMPIFVAFFILFIAGNTRFSSRLVKSLEWQYLPSQTMPKADAIVVLGGMTRNIDPPRIMPDVSERGDRLLYGAKLYKDGAAPLIVLSGGRIQWRGGGDSEAKDMASLLQLMGIPEEAMLLEPNSLNTYQNAAYTEPILEEKGIKKILLVTSAMHMPRAIAIFKKRGIDAIPAPTDFIISDRDFTEVNYSFESRILSLIPDASNLELTTQAIKEYIGTFIYRLRGWL